MTIEVFKDNFPGPDWAENFLKRHQSELRERKASNISRSRAEVSAEAINSYFDELKQSLKDVPPENIFNYDESAMTDNPGSKKMIFKRG